MSPVSVFLTVIVAPPTGSPEESVTVPRIVPRKVCASVGWPQTSISVPRHAITHTLRFRKDLFISGSFELAALQSPFKVAAARSHMLSYEFIRSPRKSSPGAAPGKRRSTLLEISRITLPARGQMRQARTAYVVFSLGLGRLSACAPILYS